MARISSSTPERIVSIKQFKGLNENRDGDTKLALGEASYCLNWRVTRDGNLQRRPGHEIIDTLSAGHPVDGMWNGWVGGYEFILAGCHNAIYLVYDGRTGEFPCSVLASITTTNGVHFFGFDSKAYILNGANYYSWDGTTFGTVDGYIPLISNGIGPIGTSDAAGTLLEQINKLTPQRRVWISPDGTNKKFQLPEKGLTSIDYVKDLATNTDIAVSSYTKDIANGTVEFNTIPAKAANSYEIGYTAASDFRSQVVGMKYSELYSGASDNRVFLYGDGTNELFYSDIDYLGTPRADYFPDMNEVAVGDANTPVTGLIRHFSRLICYKLDSTWTISASTLSLADGSLIPSFYVTAINKIIGNEAPGQVRLVLNSPRCLFHDELYEWKSSNSFSGNLTYDERQATRISDRIYNTLRSFVIKNCICYDDNPNQEYYIVYNGTALVHNYAVNAWYMYDNVYATGFATIDGELYFGTETGEIRKFAEYLKSDDTGDPDNPYQAIEAEWQSGAMDFNADYMRKYSSALWVSVKPETNSYVEISIVTDRRTDFLPKFIARGTSGFPLWDFRSFSFADDTQPQVKKLRIKAKKFTYYRLIFANRELGTVATVLSADIRSRQTGYAK